jgi:hypothetical protein
MLLQALVGITCIRGAFGDTLDHRGYPQLANESLGVTGYFVLAATGVVGVVWIALPVRARRIMPYLSLGSLVLATATAVVTSRL